MDMDEYNENENENEDNDKGTDVVQLINENNILKNQVKFLMECISNQMKNLETLCKSNKTNLIPIEYLKPYYEKTYKCDIYI
jgi:hypothetical protein